MSTNRASRRALTAFALLIALVLASLPAQARTARRPATARQAVAASGENGLARIWSFFASLLPQGITKEGVLIDPNGTPKHGSTPAAPGNSLSDEGTSIDPNGRQ